MCGSKRVGESDCPATCCCPNLSDLVTKGEMQVLKWVNMISTCM